MSRFDEEFPLPPHGKAPRMQVTHRCCSCGADTPHETLCNFGARCGRCFTAYCRAAMKDAPESPWKREEIGERAYAVQRLTTWAARHMAPLSMGQRDFLKAIQPQEVAE